MTLYTKLLKDYQCNLETLCKEGYITSDDQEGEGWWTYTEDVPPRPVTVKCHWCKSETRKCIVRWDYVDWAICEPCFREDKKRCARCPNSIVDVIMLEMPFRNYRMTLEMMEGACCVWCFMYPERYKNKHIFLILLCKNRFKIQLPTEVWDKVVKYMR